MSSCPCGSGKLFAACCGPHIAGVPAPTAEALMRSRYSAYTLGNLDYIEKTCTGRAAQVFDRSAVALSMPATQWLGLKIRQTRAGGEGDTTGTVSFIVRFREQGREFSQAETSTFRRIDGRWYYEDSEVAFKPASGTQPSPGRNDPCSCGSGRKYKKCCGLQP